MATDSAETLKRNEAAERRLLAELADAGVRGACLEVEGLAEALALREVDLTKRSDA